MPFDPLLGAGRDPSTAHTPVTVEIDGYDEDITVSSPTSTKTATIPSRTRIVAIAVKITPRNTNQNAINPTFTVYINEQVVATYGCIPFTEAGVPNFWFIGDIIPYDLDVIGEAVLKCVLNANDPGVTGYVIHYNVKAFGYST